MNSNSSNTNRHIPNNIIHMRLQDVHAGNLLVLEDGRVAFIDFGIVGRFSPDTWTGVSRLADGVAEEDFKVMAEVGRLQPLTLAKDLCVCFDLTLPEIFVLWLTIYSWNTTRTGRHISVWTRLCVRNHGVGCGRFGDSSIADGVVAEVDWKVTANVWTGRDFELRSPGGGGGCAKCVGWGEFCSRRWLVGCVFCQPFIVLMQR